MRSALRTLAAWSVGAALTSGSKCDSTLTEVRSASIGWMCSRDLAEQGDQGLGDRPRPPRAGRRTSRSCSRLGRSPCRSRNAVSSYETCAGQVLDPVSAVFQPPRALLPLDVGDRRLAGDHAFQPGMIVVRRRTAHGGAPHIEGLIVSSDPRPRGAGEESPGKPPARGADGAMRCPGSHFFLV